MAQPHSPAGTQGGSSSKNSKRWWTSRLEPQITHSTSAMAAGSACLWGPSAWRAPCPFLAPTSTDAVDRGRIPPPALSLRPASHCSSPVRILEEPTAPSQSPASLEASAPDKALGLTLSLWHSLFPGSPAPRRAGQDSRGSSHFSQTLSHFAASALS